VTALEPVAIVLSDHFFTTPNGRPLPVSVRDGTNDADVTIGLNVWGEVRGDEYRMTGRALSGWVIDVGAHIGAFSIPTALDHPDVQVIAVEAVPENADLIEQNATRNRVTDRVHLVRAYAARPGVGSAICHYGYRHDEAVSDGYISAHRFVAGTFAGRGDPEFSPEITATSLDALLARFGIDDVALLKIDCEGCEWAFLDTPAVAKVQTIIGEYHGGLTGVENPQGAILDLLGRTHEVTFWNEEPVVGLFEAVRR
jgi:FkbM family methyltransferase